MTRLKCLGVRRLSSLFCCLIVFAVHDRLVAQGPPCIVPDNGSGTVTLPPIGCGYLSPTDVHLIIAGLPPDTTIQVAAEHERFFCGIEAQGCPPPGVGCEQPGGPLGGHVDCFGSNGRLQLTGTGSLAGFNRSITIPLECQVFTGPRSPGAPLQEFNTEMGRMQGQINGDPDFDLLKITAGQEFGMPSPGHTTLTRPGPLTDWTVDSFFDVSYSIEFVGAPGGQLAGMSGSTTGTIRMTAFGSVEACCFPGGGCQVMPPSACVANGGIPQGSGTNCGNVFCPSGNEACCLPGPMCIDMTPTECHAQGGMSQGPGSICDETSCAPPAQACCFPSGDCQDLDQGACFGNGGDPQGEGTLCSSTDCPVTPTEACCFEEGGCGNFTPGLCLEFGGTPQGPETNCESTPCGLQCGPLPGGEGCFSVVCPSDTDVCVPVCVHYEPFSGFSTVTSCECRGQEQCQASIVPDGGGGGGGGGNPCVVPDNGGGTVTLPPANCAYLSPDEVHMIVDGLPPGTTIELAPIHQQFICHEGGNSICSFAQPPNVCEQMGGTLGGAQDCFTSMANFQLTGTGTLAGFNRTATVPLGCEVHTAPRNPGDPVQSFGSDMFRMFGQITNPGSGDPDFDLLRVVAGTDFGLPSPGHTTLTQLHGGSWAVDSFFDITYRIDFVGKPGGALSGMSGSTTATIRMGTGSGPACVGGCPAGFNCHEERLVNPDGSIDVCCNCEPVTQACCFDNGECADLDPANCSSIGGTPQGLGSNCLTANCEPSDCAPTPTGDACAETECPGPTEICLPTCLHHNPQTGQTTILACDCRRASACHAVIPDGGDEGGGGGGNPCVVPNNGGTVVLPPAGCEYLSPDEVHVILDGLDPGTTIEFAPIHRDFICGGAGTQVPCSTPIPPGTCEDDGGDLGGEHDCFQSQAAFVLTGTGDLAGYSRSLSLSAVCEVHTAPRTPGQPVQSFDTDMFRMFGQITGDPDFDLLRITAGTDFGHPSPGHTTLTQLPGGSWAVDSFFDITYDIEFEGAEDGPLAGLSGSTTATIRMEAGGAGVGPTCEGICPVGTVCEQVISAFYPDGSYDMCCNCVALPPECAPRPDGQGCTSVACEIDAEDCLPVCVRFHPGTGDLAVTDCDCRPASQCHAVLPGDGDGDEGGGGGGSNPCVVPDTGGTVTLPPVGCEYLSPDDVHEIVDGLPLGTTIELAPIHRNFACGGGTPNGGLCSFPTIPGVDCEDNGGSLGGQKECATSDLDLQLTGTGGLSGYSSSKTIPLQFETHVAPRTPGDPIQSFDTQMFAMQGQITGDPDFDLLRITAGNGFGLPSPGHTTLTQLPGGQWAVDSFFDITYRIDFIGAPGGPLSGMSGSTTGTIRMQTGVGSGPECEGNCPPGTECQRTVVHNTDGSIDICCECVEVECGPTPEGDDCNPVPCPVPGQQCQAVCVQYNPLTGISEVTNCACMPLEG
ncbi:MAG TPA: hypothetical protein VNT79_13700, partial [Phycisphaerae bacterium]|nr:hypothetical protein [Phycisphaerae bacterium]